jgi:hypothetical protein
VLRERKVTDMPSATMPAQNGNSCAAHCTVIAVSELTGFTRFLTQGYTERVLWPKIKFVADGTALIDALAKADNSDPERIVIEATGMGVKAALKCDDVEKTTAMGFITNTGYSAGLDTLFLRLKNKGSASTVKLENGKYYNCSYLMLPVAKAAKQAAPGMHNILVTQQNGIIYFYNSNESAPAWKQCFSDWKTLEGQNAGTHSYVFTGVYIELTM